MHTLILLLHILACIFLVTSVLVVLLMPATAPIWQVAIATSFGVVIGREIFGGIGMNFLNPALLPTGSSASL